MQANCCEFFSMLQQNLLMPVKYHQFTIIAREIIFYHWLNFVIFYHWLNFALAGDAIIVSIMIISLFDFLFLGWVVGHGEVSSKRPQSNCRSCIYILTRGFELCSDRYSFSKTLCLKLWIQHALIILFYSHFPLFLVH